MKEYIDREATLNERPEGRNPGQVGKEEYNKGWNDCRSAFYKCITSMPAADVVEVRHGRWIEDERTYPGPGLKNNLCSVCGEIAGSWKEGLEPGRKWAYCPNCGAMMDGKEDERETD